MRRRPLPNPKRDAITTTTTIRFSPFGSREAKRAKEPLDPPTAPRPPRRRSRSRMFFSRFDPWPVFFRREWKRCWPFLTGFAVTGAIITKMTAGFTEEDLKNSKFVQAHKKH
ncbi:hypothetical protein OsI_12555 [Oryza sativa Indica Group]|uniref:Uncharacterized protein n=1 Tax=Oryza sativa subsp. indica TaxID=39946 RepID=A2XJD1_ORYSI|nr:hypothetical protein OsI_12555 [Oryza sativa Indica Group]